MSAVVVLDIGKTNIKLTAAAGDGTILEALSLANTVVPGPPYRHPDLAGIEAWLLGELGPLARRHGAGSFVATSHGSAGVLVDESGPVMPSIDYEERPPAAIDAAYRRQAGPLEDRGSPIMAGSAHLARQLLWLQTEWPEAVSRARWFLGGPQYWAWRLSGVAAAELTYLGAQSHLWNIPGRRFAALVERQGWGRLIPPTRQAWDVLGPVRSELAARYGIPPDLKILCGIHDSSANFYRYQQAGLRDLAVVSTGTWIVGVTDSFDPEALGRTSGMTWNADVEGHPLTGMLAMGGRDYAAIAGDAPDTPADAGAISALVARGTMALPSFSPDDGPFRGSAGRGRVAGPPPASPAERRALALLYVALLTDACLDRMGDAKTTVLDGSFVNDPLYGALVAALRPARPILISTDGAGTASGAALLAGHGQRSHPARVPLDRATPLAVPGLDKYRGEWRKLAAATEPAERRVEEIAR